MKSELRSKMKFAHGDSSKVIDNSSIEVQIDNHFFSFISSNKYLIFVIMLGAVIPAFSTMFQHATNVPMNDSWSYEETALVFFKHGFINTFGFSQATLLAQVILVQPLLFLFDGSNIAFEIYSIFVTVIYLLGAYRLSTLFLSKKKSFLACVASIVCSGFLATTTSFMTDVTALAAIIWSLYFGCKINDSIGSKKTCYLFLSLLVGLIGISDRQFVAAAPFAILIFYLINKRSERVYWVASTMLFSFFVFLELYLSRSFSNSLSGSNYLPSLISMGQSFKSLSTLSLSLLPLSTYAFVKRPPRLYITIFYFAAGSVFAPFFPSPLLGNMMTQFGITGNQVLAGTAPKILSNNVWLFVNILSGISEVLLFIVFTGIILKKFNDRKTSNFTNNNKTKNFRVETLLWMFILFFTAEIILLTRSISVDRYVWPLVVPAAICLLLSTDGEFRNKTFPRILILSFAFLYLLQLLFMINYYAFSVAKWNAGEQLAQSRIPYKNIDAGYEWFGFNQALVSQKIVNNPKENVYVWYESLFSTTKVKAFVSNSVNGSPNLKYVGHVTYKTFWLFGDQRMLYKYVVVG